MQRNDTVLGALAIAGILIIASASLRSRADTDAPPPAESEELCIDEPSN